MLRYPCNQLLGALMVLCFINQCLNYKQHYSYEHNISTVTVRPEDICNSCTMVCLTLLHSERPKLYAILAFLSAIGLRNELSHVQV